MRKILAALIIAAVCFGPTVVLLGIGLVMNPAAKASCLPGMSLTVGPIPDSLDVTTKNGERFTLNRKQLTHAATIITVGGQTDGIDTRGVTIALMAALTESTLRQLANTGTYPESGNYPNDGNGSDHDSLGLFQMRPRSEEHTSELQSRGQLVCRLLLEKKKTNCILTPDTLSG